MNDIDADAPTAAMDGHDSVIGLQRNPHLSGARPERDLTSSPRENELVTRARTVRWELMGWIRF